MTTPVILPEAKTEESAIQPLPAITESTIPPVVLECERLRSELATLRHRAPNAEVQRWREHAKMIEAENKRLRTENTSLLIENSTLRAHLQGKPA